ncbi:hypothetical protein FWH58_01505 [Candidatus Saccharibacteria bacterium]|nr:hypothetical protein [Candidatus Saccharibacteria bacterium]
MKRLTDNLSTLSAEKGQFNEAEIAVFETVETDYHAIQQAMKSNAKGAKHSRKQLDDIACQERIMSRASEYVNTYRADPTGMKHKYEERGFLVEHFGDIMKIILADKKRAEQRAGAVASIAITAELGDDVSSFALEELHVAQSAVAAADYIVKLCYVYWDI